MCNYIYKELKCQHHYHLVESWCPKYIETQKRCPPTIVSKQYWGDDICGACRERKEPTVKPWAKMIRRPKSSSRVSPYSYYQPYLYYQPYPRKSSSSIRPLSHRSLSSRQISAW